ncbi:methyltransferase family protein [Anaerorhabdus furcosa]|uniref:Protein-S-isoprenylcysteine O-methyltransferase Ste14 n=1 Tax=Anaerorhabdus furcosa TaxID=118967 RepID=A0A1T4Q5A5_9FIRM|nr:isoprenylcysteine carboxylmethyltransferase family protein [Anaerorhabdus furcosa]SJZ98953.1 Protein-S-isoprenylcysteine O-methyltransferase Ste14 [Anaerorhabdus furcosa]
MNGFWLLVPFLLIRFVYLSKLNKHAIKRAAHFPNMQGYEVIAYYIYQFSTIGLCLYLIFLKIDNYTSWLFFSGVIIYCLGLILCTLTIHDFAKPSSTGINRNGIYRYSRNPMYVSYFFIFVGCALLTESILLLIIVLIFQISSHWIILSEEKWCKDQFKEEYIQYMKSVKRYF